MDSLAFSEKLGPSRTFDLQSGASAEDLKKNLGTTIKNKTKLCRDAILLFLMDEAGEKIEIFV